MELHETPPLLTVGKYIDRFLARGLAPVYIVQVRDAVASAGWQGRDAPGRDVAVVFDRHDDPGPTANDALASIELSDTTYIGT